VILQVHVSLLVHEKPDVVRDQLKNFSRYLPDATVMLHISANADFEEGEILNSTDRAANQHVILNPVRLKTAWGDMLDPHLANIRHFRALGCEGVVVFHASNDMYVRHGAQGWMMETGTGYGASEIGVTTDWSWASHAYADPLLREMITKSGGKAIFAGQIEGSFYRLVDLYQMMDSLDECSGKTAAPYPREEIYFATYAKAKGIEPTGAPLVFSEIHHADVLHFLRDLKIRKSIRSIFRKRTSAKISERCVLCIRNPSLFNLAFHLSSRRRSENWKPRHFYAVKRVPRDMTSQLRKFIKALGD
jgi:hypothetical protein